MINNALRLIRVFHDMSQKDLANKLSVSNSYLSEIESGKKSPSLEIIEKYSQIFNMPPSSILFFSETIDESKRSERVRRAISKKIVSLLEWLDEKAELGNAK